MAQLAAALPSSIDQRRTLWNGWFIGIIAVVAFSITTPVGRAAISAGMDPVVLTVGRYVLASTLILGTIGVSSPSKLKIDRQGMFIALGVGLINGGSSLAYFSALGRMSSSVAAVLVSVYPVIVLSLLALRGENFTRRNLARMALGFSGVYLLVGPGGVVDGLSIFLVLLTATGYSIQLVLVQWFLKDYPARTITVYIVIGNTIAATFFWLLRGPQWTSPNWQGWLSIAVLAIVGTYLARLATIGAVKGIGSGQVALLAPLETMLTVIWSVLFLAERLSFLQWLGSLLVVTSALFAIQRWGHARPRLRWRAWSRP